MLEVHQLQDPINQIEKVSMKIPVIFMIWFVRKWWLQFFQISRDNMISAAEIKH